MKDVPFNVICVAAGNWDYANNCAAKSVLEVGSPYTVTQVMYDARAAYYKLEEIEGRYFYAELFAILPDQSADEMQEQEREGIVNLENVSACQK